MTQTIVLRPKNRQTPTPRRSLLKRSTFLGFAVAGLTGIIVAILPLTGRSQQLPPAPQPGPDAAEPAALRAKVTSLLTKDLKDLPGKEGLMITVEYPPGCVDPVHRHNAHAFVYVLEGSIHMQVKGGKQVTLTPGQTFYEGPDDIHTVGRNASTKEPAKFVVFMVKDKGAPLLIPEK